MGADLVPASAVISADAAESITNACIERSAADPAWPGTGGDNTSVAPLPAAASGPV